MTSLKRNMFSLLSNDEMDDNDHDHDQDQDTKQIENIKTDEQKIVQEKCEEKCEENTHDENTHDEFEKIEKDKRRKFKFENNRSENNRFENNRSENNRFENNRSENNRFENNRTDTQNVFRDEKLLDNKILYDDNKNYGEIGNDKKLNSYWTVWVHKINCADWTLSGYQKIYVINSIGSFWRFFNNFQLINTYQNQIFIMREEIAPIWEDVNNKFGGICSVKIDSIQKGMKTDLSTEVFALISLLIMNETFVGQNKNLNGISYSVKKRSSLIKVWTKTFSEQQDFTKDLPVPLMNKLNVEMQKQSKNVLNNDGKISIQYKQIKPEFEI